VPRDGSATRTRLLDAAEKLVIDHGYAATSVDDVIAAAGSSKGAFFHHFASKGDLARALVARYAAADVAHLDDGLRAAREQTDDPAEQVVAFLRVFEDGADDLMSAQSSCLYVSVLTERELATADTTDQIRGAIEAWRTGLADLLGKAFAARPPRVPLDPAALADHVFVTFEGAFVLCRATGDPSHMKAQLGALRALVETALGV
jgi:TetR/AcrR family transcriptional regulator, transcriptional repressor for nem operon